METFDTHIILLKGCNRKRLQPFALDRNTWSIYTIVNTIKNINNKYVKISNYK